MVVIRMCHELEEMRACVALQKEVWKFSDAELVPLRLFVVADKVGGQVIGATDRRGEHAIERRVGVGDFLATVYRHLGIDAERVEIRDITGRPVPILREGKPIPELTASES